MTTALLPDRIVISDRPAELQSRIEELQQRERAAIEARARHADARQLLQLLRTLLTIGGIVFAFIALVGFTPGLPGTLGIVFGLGLASVGQVVLGGRLRKHDARPPDLAHGRCAAAAWLLGKLQADLAAGRRIQGQIDLRPVETGAAVRASEAGPGGSLIQRFRQPWLRLEARLHDGNELRLVAAEQLKLRPGYYRLGSISRKRKWKPDKRRRRQQVSVRLLINPGVYWPEATRPLAQGSRAGTLTVLRARVDGGVLRLVAADMSDRPDPEAILMLLRAIYAGLERRA